MPHADINAKSEKTLIDVLRGKHSEARRPELEKEDWASFEEYPTPREGSRSIATRAYSKWWRESSAAVRAPIVSMG